MKITKSQLKQLIKEELEQSIDEAWDSAGNWKSRYSNRQDVEPETDEERKHRREKEERRRREREDLGYPPEKSKYFEEREQLDEAPIIPMIMSALKHPQVQQVLMDLVMPIIQNAMSGGDEGPPAE